METLKEIRLLKGQTRRRAPRGSLDESLLGRIEEGTERQLSLPEGSLTQILSTSPVLSPAATPFASAPAGRNGRQLWAAARSHMPEIHEMAEAQNVVPQNGGARGSFRGGEAGGINAKDRRKSIVEKFMFTLGTPPSQRLEEVVNEIDGGTAEGAAAVRREAPGMWAPASDLHHIGHMLYGSSLNVLLLAIPIGIFAGATHASANLIFWSNFLALLPLALILGEITEDLAVRFGDTIGGLLNATFGNVVEMILGLAALSQGLYKVVAASLIGSILSNLLLVLGCCFLFGGFKHKHQRFNTLANKVSSSLLFLASISVIIPTAAKSVYGDAVMTKSALTNLSHAIALMLIGLYICYLFFQLKTHADSLGSSSSEEYLHYMNPGNDSSNVDIHSFENSSAAAAAAAAVQAVDNEHKDEEEDDDDDDHVPHLSLSGSLLSLSSITIAVAICSEFLTGAIEEVSESSGINQAFLGLIVLPIAGNAAEHITAVFVAVKNKMDLAISVALGSSIQIATFVLPVTVLAGWVMGKELTLDFDPFAVLMMTVSVILAYFVSSDGSSNWLLGLQLVVTYTLIGAVYFLEKESEAPSPGDILSLNNSTVAGL